MRGCDACRVVPASHAMGTLVCLAHAANVLAFLLPHRSAEKEAKKKRREEAGPDTEVGREMSQHRCLQHGGSLPSPVHPYLPHFLKILRTVPPASHLALSSAQGQTQGAGDTKDADAGGAAPSLELPPELQEYSGDPDDRKAMLLFRQAQQTERRRLEKARDKWLGAELRRQRELESRLKEEVGGLVGEACLLPAPAKVGSMREAVFNGPILDPTPLPRLGTEGGGAGRSARDRCRRGRPGKVLGGCEGLSCQPVKSSFPLPATSREEEAVVDLSALRTSCRALNPASTSPGCKTPRSSSWRGCSCAGPP